MLVSLHVCSRPLCMSLHVCSRQRQKTRREGKRVWRESFVLAISTPRGKCPAVKLCVLMKNGPRQGAQFVEVWVEGFAFADLNVRQEELASQREELEKLKKQISKKKGTVASTQREQLEREELLKIRAAVLKKVWCQEVHKTLYFLCAWHFLTSGGLQSEPRAREVGARTEPPHQRTEKNISRRLIAFQVSPNPQ